MTQVNCCNIFITLKDLQATHEILVIMLGFEVEVEEMTRSTKPYSTEDFKKCAKPEIEIFLEHKYERPRKTDFKTANITKESLAILYTLEISHYVIRCGVRR
jgi:hypothetical protein